MWEAGGRGEERRRANYKRQSYNKHFLSGKSSIRVSISRNATTKAALLGVSEFIIALTRPKLLNLNDVGSLNVLGFIFPHRINVKHYGIN